MSFALVLDLAGSKAYLRDVSAEECVFALQSLLWSLEDNWRGQHDLRALFNSVRYVVPTANQGRIMPHDLPPCLAVYQYIRRWMRAEYFELLVEDVQGPARVRRSRSDPRRWPSTAAHCNPRSIRRAGRLDFAKQ